MNNETTYDTLLSASLGRYPHTDGLFASPLVLRDGSRLQAEFGGLGGTARRMIRELAFDICDMPIVNYLSAKEHGLEATALPLFVTRRFPQGMLIWNTEAGVHQPVDLIGKRIGIPYHGNTDAVWVRGLLKDTYGVDESSITWVTGQEEQIPQALLPGNVEQIPGAALDQMLLAGEIGALVETRGQTIFAPQIECLAANVEEAEASWYASTGLFPILYTVVIKDSTLRDRPDLAPALFEAFNAAKTAALAKLEAGIPLSDEELAACKVSGFPTKPTGSSQRAYLGPDPLAYGFESNRLPIETVMRYALDQHVTYIDADPSERFLELD